MSIGGFDPLREHYLKDLRAFCDRVKSPWHSDHLCFSTFGGLVLHDLLPIAFKKSEVTRIAERIKRAQDAVGRPMAIENVSFYLHPGKREMTEGEFIAQLCETADCGLMLDVNNAYVNATNFGFDVDTWMRTAPLDRVVQMHVAGHDWYTDEDWAATEPRSPEEREGALIVGLDRRGRWFRYHGLFRELLRSRLDQEHPGLRADLHARAGSWLATSGRGREALPHIVAAKPTDALVRVLGDGWVDLLLEAPETETVVRAAQLLRWTENGEYERVQAQASGATEQAV
jgi:hypothetical protein